MPIVTVWHARLWLEPVEDQVFADVGGVVQDSKPGLMTTGVAVDLLQMAKRVGPQCEVIEYEDLARKKDIPSGSIVVDDGWSHRTF